VTVTVDRPRRGGTQVLPDAITIAGRDISHWAARPGSTAVGWLFPVLILLMFAGLFGGAIGIPGRAEADYLDFLMPGMLALSMLFGLETTMTAVATDVTRGITDRFRSLPTTGTAVVLGRCLADLLSSVIGTVVLIGAGLALGWRWDAGIGATAAAFGLLVLLRFGVLWVGVYLGLRVSGPEGVAAVQILVWPLGFLSSVFVDPDTMPGWLGWAAEWNPVSSTVTAVRELLGSPMGPSGSWVAGHAVLMAVVWPLVLTAVFLPLAARRYRNLSR
jgi:ABC-2 type transport system permease protein